MEKYLQLKYAVSHVPEESFDLLEQGLRGIVG